MKNWLLILMFMSSGCALLDASTMKNPKVDLESVDVQDARIDGATLMFNLKVDNPNAFDLNLDKLKYTLDMADRTLASGEVTKGLHVEASKVSTIRLPVPIKFADVFHSVSALIGQGSTPYHLKGAAYLGPLRLPFDEKGKFKFENGRIVQEK